MRHTLTPGHVAPAGGGFSGQLPLRVHCAGSRSPMMAVNPGPTCPDTQSSSRLRPLQSWEATSMTQGQQRRKRRQSGGGGAAAGGQAARFGDRVK